MTVAETIPILEGLVGNLDAAPQGVAVWLQCMKIVLRSQQLRLATDWEIDVNNDVDNSSDEVDADGGTFYGILVRSVDTSDTGVLVARDTTTAFTLDSGAMNAAETAANEFVAVSVQAAGSATDPGYGCFIDPMGVPCIAGITIAYDDVGGADAGANEVRSITVYRDGTEVQV